MKINLATGFCVASFALTTSIVACGPSAAPTDGATKTGPTPTNEPPRSDPPSSSDPAPSVVLDSADAGPLDASADAAFPDPQCGSLARSACVTCCNIAYAAMADAFRSTLANCVCSDPGECASDCGSNYCAGMSASPACAACIQGSTTCGPATIKVCEAEPECAAYLTCQDACPAQ